MEISSKPDLEIDYYYKRDKNEAIDIPESRGDYFGKFIPNSKCNAHRFVDIGKKF